MTKTWLMVTLGLINVVSTGLSVVAFKHAGAALETRAFLWQQILGNFWGFVSVIAFTFLTRYLALNVAYPVTVGLAVLLVQLVFARLYFGEVATPPQIIGALFIAMGIVLVARRP
jgi:multidrug transporter EmrE-like cation transporter